MKKKSDTAKHSHVQLHIYLPPPFSLAQVRSQVAEVKRTRIRLYHPPEEKRRRRKRKRLTREGKEGSRGRRNWGVRRRWRQRRMEKRKGRRREDEATGLKALFCPPIRSHPPGPISEEQKHQRGNNAVAAHDNGPGKNE